MSTGGSTGSPVTIMVDRERAAFTDATRLRAHRWFGVDMGSPELVLWGSPIETGRQDLVRNVRDRLFNTRLLSAFDLGEAALARHADVVARVRPRKLFGYASAVHLLARYLQAHGQPAGPDRPRVVFTTAEPLYDFQRRTIESAFGCPVPWSTAAGMLDSSPTSVRPAACTCRARVSPSRSCLTRASVRPAGVRSS
jgi:phenylacetate-CoA ligase